MIDKTSLVSVIIPSYNHEKYIRDAIYSVLKQSYSNIELIVIDDGSTDNTRKIISEILQKEKFIYIEQENIGVAKTINRGIKISTGEYLSFLASDDLFHTNKIECLLRKFSQVSSDTAIIFGDALLINEKNDAITLNFKETYGKTFLELYLKEIEYNFLKINNHVTYKQLIRKNFIPAMSVLCKAQYIKELGFFPEEYMIEDYPMWLKVVKKYKIAYTDEIVASYRIHGKNSISTHKQSFIIEQVKILKKEFCYATYVGCLHYVMYRYAKLIIAYIVNKKK